MEANEAREKILALRAEVEEHSRRYYDEDAPTISDFEYDKLIHTLMDLEEQFPQFLTPDSPTQHVGGKVSSKFAPVQHEVPLESLMDVFSHGNSSAAPPAETGRRAKTLRRTCGRSALCRRN